MDRPAIDVDTLRDLIRSLHQFQALYEDEGVDEITDEWGRTWSLWDVWYLYDATQERLPERQAQAIRLFLLEGGTEQDVAVAMGIKPSNPIGQYATRGLRAIVALATDGQLPRYRIDGGS